MSDNANNANSSSTDTVQSFDELIYEKKKRGRPTENPKSNMIQVRVTNDLHRFISRSSMIREITESEFVRSVLQEKLDEEIERGRQRKIQLEEERKRKLEEMRKKGMFFFN